MSSNMDTRYRVRIDGERQAFAHLIVDSLTALDPDRICAFQVEHPQEDVAHIYVNATSFDEAADAVGRACGFAMQRIERIVRDLQLPPASVDSTMHLQMPSVSVGAARRRD